MVYRRGSSSVLSFFPRLVVWSDLTYSNVLTA